jgi:hypothetical protein
MMSADNRQLISFLVDGKLPKDAYARLDTFNYQLLLAAKAGTSVFENEVLKLNNLPYSRELQGHFSIRDIFIKYWDRFLTLHADRNIRPAILDNVRRMMNCHDFKNGYLFFACPNCDNYHVVGFSCHSRFCPSCGKKCRDARTLEIAKKCLAVPHRQFVFSIAKELRPYFRIYRKLFDVLFQSVHEAFDYLITGKSKIAKAEGRSLGYVQFLHTFGRDMKFNPHIHVLIAERTLDDAGKLSKYDYFNYESLRKSFMSRLLKNMYAFLKDHATKSELAEFYQLKTQLYKRYVDGFYAHGPKLVDQSRVAMKKITEYIARYAAHPAISESRITAVDYVNHTISYYYDPHEDDHQEDESLKRGRQFVTESVFDFMQKLIIHIPDKGVHTIRYYGFYANRSKLPKKHHALLYPRHEVAQMKQRLFWRFNIRHAYRFDPLLCHCGSTMLLVYDLSFFPNTKPGGG